MFYLEDLDYQEIRNSFLAELKNAVTGKSSSLSFIKNQLPQEPFISNGLTQLIVIGGSNFVTTIDKITNGKNKTLKKEFGTLPIFKSATTFSNFMEKLLAPNIDALAINFAFPLSPFINSAGLPDGKLIMGTKEHSFAGLLNIEMGNFLKDLYLKKFGQTIPMSVANDTVCLALSGTGLENGGLVLGSGINISLKIIGNGVKYIANLEAGNFSGFAQDAALQAIDNRSTNKGTMFFEKTVSGNYLQENYKEISKLLKLKTIEVENSKQMSDLAESDQTISGDLSRELFKRSACLVAACVAAIYEFMGKPDTLTFITEGSLFWKGWKYEESLREQLKKLEVPSEKINFQFIDDSSLKGALALLIK